MSYPSVKCTAVGGTKHCNLCTLTGGMESADEPVSCIADEEEARKTSSSARE